MVDKLEIRHVDFNYDTTNEKIIILKNADYTFVSRRMYVVMGPSGSGKTTLLSLLGALDEPKSGQVLFNGKNLKELGYSSYRNQDVGIVFQTHNLLNYMTVIQNVESVMEISGYKKKNKREKAEYCLQRVEIDSSKFDRDIKKLSGGEQQRVAIARAIAMDKKVILADEPTGNLDMATALEIIRLFQSLAHEDGKCVIVATHSEALAAAADVKLELINKRLYEKNI